MTSNDKTIDNTSNDNQINHKSMTTKQMSQMTMNQMITCRLTPESNKYKFFLELVYNLLVWIKTNTINFEIDS